MYRDHEGMRSTYGRTSCNSSFLHDTSISKKIVPKKGRNYLTVTELEEDE